MFEIISDHTLRTVLLGSVILGIVSGVMSTFAVLRKQSLMGDVIAHAALPGLILAYLLSGASTILVLLIGAGFSGWLGMLLSLSIVQQSRLTLDNAFGLILSVFFGLGILLLNYVQNSANSGHAGLENFLFGQAAALLISDVWLSAICGAVILLVVALLWKEFKLFVFDPDFFHGVYDSRFVGYLLTGLITITIVLGLQTVGVVLMASIIVAPAAAARQWVDNLLPMTILSGVIGGLAGALGTSISALSGKLPTGPVIVVILSIFVMVSILFSPKRGLIWRWFSLRATKHHFQMDLVLDNLYSLALQHKNSTHPHAETVIARMSVKQLTHKYLAALKTLGWAQQNHEGLWYLTDAGQRRAAANRAVRERDSQEKQNSSMPTSVPLTLQSPRDQA